MACFRVLALVGGRYLARVLGTSSGGYTFPLAAALASASAASFPATSECPGHHCNFTTVPPARSFALLIALFAAFTNARVAPLAFPCTHRMAVWESEKMVALSIRGVDRIRWAAMKIAATSASNIE
jgi:hypothetical protein